MLFVNTNLESNKATLHSRTANHTLRYFEDNIYLHKHSCILIYYTGLIFPLLQTIQCAPRGGCYAYESRRQGIGSL